MKIKNVVEHFCTITKHRWVVFKLCTKVGEPWRGLVHDLSKYSPTEFWEGVKYFNGHHSPITDYPLNENVKKVITEVLEQVSKNGIDSTLTKKNIKSLYKKYCIDQIN